MWHDLIQARFRHPGRAFRDHAVMTTPDEDLRKMAEYEARAEQAYDEMYKTSYPLGLYSDLKDFFALAIDAAERAGRPDEAARLYKRCDHCREVYRKHFDR
jgi:hypothetical protein